MDKEQLQSLAQRIMNLDHMGIQCDNIHHCEEKHQAILELDTLPRHQAVRLLMHIIHVQGLQLVGAEIRLDPENPFREMTRFPHIMEYLAGNSPDQETLY
jgi:hypothetical protein